MGPIGPQSGDESPDKENLHDEVSAIITDWYEAMETDLNISKKRSNSKENILSSLTKKTPNPFDPVLNNLANIPVQMRIPETLNIKNLDREFCFSRGC